MAKSHRKHQQDREGRRDQRAQRHAIQERLRQQREHEEDVRILHSAVGWVERHFGPVDD